MLAPASEPTAAKQPRSEPRKDISCGTGRRGAFGSRFTDDRCKFASLDLNPEPDTIASCHQLDILNYSSSCKGLYEL